MMRLNGIMSQAISGNPLPSSTYLYVYVRIADVAFITLSHTERYINPVKQSLACPSDWESIQCQILNTEDYHMINRLGVSKPYEIKCSPGCCEAI